MPGYFVENFGCRATQADGAALERQFEEQGMVRAATVHHASIVVLNTCTVTAGADQDARAAIRRVRRHNPDAQIVVTGCYAQRAPNEIAALPGVSIVIGNSHKHQLAQIVGATAVRSPDESVCRDVSDFEKHSVDFGEHSADSGWRSASSAAIAPASHPGAFTPQGLAFVPLTNLTAPPGSREPETGSPIFVSDIFAHTELLAAPVFDAANERTRPNLKVQDGCDNRCSFCVIPFVRGQSRSLPLDRILREVNGLVDSGYREVVISGINLGRWGRDLSGFPEPASGVGRPAPGLRSPAFGDRDASAFRISLSESISGSHKPVGGSRDPEAGSPKPDARSRQSEAGSRKPTLENLIRAILSGTSLEKLRISSVEPMDWTDDLISLVASSPRIARHAHVPMQSGSDAVLRRMHRKYRPWHYREKIEKIRTAMPTAAIGADVMVGFPGETDAEFESTRCMIEDLPFTYLHVFTYSARPGTPAAGMAHQIPVQVARERNRILRELAAEKKLAFMRSFIGKQVEAITLNVIGHDANGEFTEALSDNYLKLRLRGHHAPNHWLHAAVEDVVDGSLVGRAQP